MSDNETLKSTTDPDSCLSEMAKSGQQDNVEDTSVATVENQNAPMQDIDCKISHGIEDQTIEMSAKEVNAASIEDMKIICETVNKSLEKKVEDSTTSEAKQNVSSPNIPEIQQETAIGAGDIFSVTKQDGNADVEKPEEQIALTGMVDPIKPENDKSVIGDDNNVTEHELLISKLKEEVQKAANERDSYQKKLESAEKKLTELQATYDALLKGEGNEVMLRRMVDQLKGKLIQTSLQLEDRIRTVSNQEKQISALNNQVASLKEVESLTRSLLQIRNMEVKHLQAEVDDMEVRISEERERYNTMINKMDAAVKLNADLKKEYETQLCLFRDLREKYEEKVSLLSEEKRALEANVQSPK
ncbi:tropomyosin-1 isoform X1 [Bombus impatiens]|uniref:Tropomyosin-1 isoform X1 n=1 Tax=Bombus impatiens TaxID=132113 RepID=A0A6P3DZE9_BOMIM|nr:tropomyosin-1 isoform X1 [Bombus impatiens]